MHRVADSKARYRLWPWLAVAAGLASMDSVAGLHEVWSAAWVGLTGWAALGGAVWWLVPVSLLGAWLGVLTILETAECRGACCLVCASMVGYATALLAGLGVLPGSMLAAAPVVLSTAVLAGHVVALAAITLYARYIVLDVQGLIPHSNRTADKAPNVAGDRAPKHREVGPATLPMVESGEADPAELPHCLTKAERKRLRKQQRKCA